MKSFVGHMALLGAVLLLCACSGDAGPHGLAKALTQAPDRTLVPGHCSDGRKPDAWGNCNL